MLISEILSLVGVVGWITLVLGSASVVSVFYCGPSCPAEHPQHKFSE